MREGVRLCTRLCETFQYSRSHVLHVEAAQGTVENSKFGCHSLTLDVAVVSLVDISIPRIGTEPTVGWPQININVIGICVLMLQVF